MANRVVNSDHRGHRALSYTQMRVLLLCGGLGFLGITAAVSYARRVETAEVVAILLFIPIFVAFVFWDWAGGVLAAALATAAYVALRTDAIQAVGLDQFIGVIISRSMAFFAFGFVGGIANRHVRSSLMKLDLYDHVDDTTGLYNARYLLEAFDLEVSRAKRYQSVFSVSVIDIPAATFDGVNRRRRDRVLREIGHGVRSSVRTVDRVAHAADGDRYRFAVVLPETGEEGARIFTDRLADRLGALLGITTITSLAVTYPGDDEALRQLTDDFAAVDRTQHPEHPPKLGIVAA
jgi:diguanylate cyclase (GGDEF)-like protein